MVSATPAPALPLSDVAEKAEAALLFARESLRATEPEEEERDLRRSVPELRKLMGERLSRTDSVLAVAPTLDTLAELEREWTDHASALGKIRRRLGRLAAEMEGRVGVLDSMIALWKRAASEAASTEAPPSVLQTIRKTLSEVEAARGEARDRRDEFLELQTTTGEDELMLGEALGRVREERRLARGRLFRPDSPPLWAIYTGESATVPLGEQVSTALASRLEGLWTFIESRNRTLRGLMIVFVVALLSAYGMRARVRRWTAEDPALGNSASLLERPLSMAAIIALSSVSWLYPLAPDAVRDLVGLLALGPVVRLLLRLSEASFRPIVYAVACFYLFGQLRELVEQVPAVERPLLALECVAAGLVLAWLLRLARANPDSSPSLVLGVRVAAALFGLSFLANLAGYAAFATLLADGTLTSVYVAVVLYVGLRVARVTVSVVINSRRARSLGVVRARGVDIRRGLQRGLTWAAVIAWAAATLGQFSLYDWAESHMRALLTAPLEIGTIEISIGNVLGFAASVAAAFALSNLIRFVLQEDVFPRLEPTRGARTAITTLTHYGVLLVGFLFALGAAGIDWSRFAVLAGAFGVGIGFGLQNVVNNFVSGLILLVERPIQVGDYIEVGGLLGEVRSIGIRSSTVRTFQGAEVLVPNGDLISSQVINWTLSDPLRRLEVPVGVAYGSDPDQVIELLREAAGETAGVLHHPEPFSLFVGFGDSSLDFEVRAWTGDYLNFRSIESQLRLAVHRRIVAAGIEIPFPQRDVHVRSPAPRDDSV